MNVSTEKNKEDMKSIDENLWELDKTVRNLEDEILKKKNFKVYQHVEENPNKYYNEEAKRLSLVTQMSREVSKNPDLNVEDNLESNIDENNSLKTENSNNIPNELKASKEGCNLIKNELQVESNSLECLSYNHSQSLETDLICNKTNDHQPLDFDNSEKFMPNVISTEINSSDLNHLKIPSNQISMTQMMPNQMIPNQMFPAQIIPNQIIPNQIIPNQIIPNQMVPNQIIPNQMIPNQIIPNQIISNQIIPNQIIPNQIIPNQMIPSQMIPNQIISNQMVPNQVSSCVPMQINSNFSSAQNQPFFIQMGSISPPFPNSYVKIPPANVTISQIQIPSKSIVPPQTQLQSSPFPIVPPNSIQVQQNLFSSPDDLQSQIPVGSSPIPLSTISSSTNLPIVNSQSYVEPSIETPPIQVPAPANTHPLGIDSQILAKYLLTAMAEECLTKKKNNDFNKDQFGSNDESSITAMKNSSPIIQPLLQPPKANIDFSSPTYFSQDVFKKKCKRKPKFYKPAKYSNVEQPNNALNIKSEDEIIPEQPISPPSSPTCFSFKTSVPVNILGDNPFSESITKIVTNKISQDPFLISNSQKIKHFNINSGFNVSLPHIIN